MPWIETDAMEQIILFIADYLRSEASMADLCMRYGISRKTGYKWLNRFKQEGVDGLQERSRRPQHTPARVSHTVREAIVTLRRDSAVTLGSKKIQVLLKKRFGEDSVPSKTTIYNILNAEGLITSQRVCRRFKRSVQPFDPVDRPNQVWSVDFKGQFKTLDGKWVFPLTVMDHESRYLLACEGKDGPHLKPTKQTFDVLFRRYGLPDRIRSDNGSPFASNGVAGLSRLAIWWIEQGIVPERIKPGRPQQNGRHERMHRTLKDAVCYPASKNHRAQQKAFDAFRQHYNEHRPHEALEQVEPAACYRPSEKVYSPTPEPLDYPGWFERAHVAQNGIACFRGMRIYVGGVLGGKKVGLEAIEDGVWEMYFGPVVLGTFDQRRSMSKSKADDYYNLQP